MTYAEVERRVLGGARAIHPSWPAQDWRCYLFARDGAVWIHHTDGSEHPVGDAHRTLYLERGSPLWTTELTD